MRPSCLYCATKHISQAIILFSEAAQGYPTHWYLALGHMAEAGDELIRDYPQEAAAVRAERKRLEVLPADRRGGPNQLMDFLTHLSYAAEPVKPSVPHDTERIELTTEAAQAIEYQHQGSAELQPHDFTVTAGLQIGTGHLAALGVDSVIQPPGGETTGVFPPVPCSPCEENARRIREAEAALNASRDAAEQVRAEAGKDQIRHDEHPVYADQIAPLPYDGPTSNRHVVILTTLANFDPSYSLSTCIQDQANALAISGYTVDLHVHEGCQPPEHAFMPGVTLRGDVPHTPWVDDRVDDKGFDDWYGFLTKIALANAGSVVIGHDLLFQSAYVTAAKALHAMADTLATRLRSVAQVAHWYHIAHSSVGARPQTADVALHPTHWRCNLPMGNHSLVVLDAPDRRYFQDYYKKTILDVVSNEPYLVPVNEDDIHVIHNVRDVRSFGGFSPLMRDLVTNQGLLERTVVSYPLSATRMQEKGIVRVVELVHALSEAGEPTTLVIAAAHANPTPDMTARIDQLKSLCNAFGLRWGVDVLFTPELYPETAARGLLASDMRALWSITDLFMFPSISEAGSLVLLEAQAAGAVLVLNECLASSADYIKREDAVWVPWGSSREPGRTWDATAVVVEIGKRLSKRGRRSTSSTWEHLGANWKGIIERA